MICFDSKTPIEGPRATGIGDDPDQIATAAREPETPDRLFISYRRVRGNRPAKARTVGDRRGLCIDSIDGLSMRASGRERNILVELDKILYGQKGT